MKVVFVCFVHEVGCCFSLSVAHSDAPFKNYRNDDEMITTALAISSKLQILCLHDFTAMNEIQTSAE